MLAAGLGRNASYTFMTEDRAMAAAKMLLDLGADVNAANDAWQHRVAWSLSFAI